MRCNHVRSSPSPLPYSIAEKQSTDASCTTGRRITSGIAPGGGDLGGHLRILPTTMMSGNEEGGKNSSLPYFLSHPIKLSPHFSHPLYSVPRG